ncbi:transposase [uncultured Formosa sp.]
MTYGFSKFEHAAQLSSYVGITATIRESRSSMKGRSRISKVAGIRN